MGANPIKLCVAVHACVLYALGFIAIQIPEQVRGLAHAYTHTGREQLDRWRAKVATKADKKDLQTALPFPGQCQTSPGHWLVGGGSRGGAPFVRAACRRRHRNNRDAAGHLEFLL